VTGIDKVNLIKNNFKNNQLLALMELSKEDIQKEENNSLYYTFGLPESLITDFCSVNGKWLY
ncbi:MAG: hypothetical protein KGO92_14210, partial [Bacteroidota bacterium]|nr:hypothetical protein [Bacteroidota bacterium]